LHGETPSSTTLPRVVIRLDDAPVWKMNTPPPDSVSGVGPLMVNDPSDQGGPAEVDRLQGDRALPRRLLVRRGQIVLRPQRDAIGDEGAVGSLDEWGAGDRRTRVDAQVPGDGRGAGVGDRGVSQDREGCGRSQIHRGCC
jgi:hypothetical protein